MTITKQTEEQFIGSVLSNQDVLTMAANPTNGDTLYLIWNAGDTTRSITGISQVNVTWTNVTAVHTNRTAELWKGVVGASALAAITVTRDATPAIANSYGVQAWRASGGTLTQDVSSFNNANSAAPSSGTITPTSGYEAVIVVGGRIGGAYTSGPDGGFTGLTSFDGGSRGYGGYLLPTNTSGTYAAAWVAGSGNWAMVYGVLRGASSGTVISDNNFQDINRGSIRGLHRGLSYHNQPQISAEELKFRKEEYEKKLELIQKIQKAA